MSVTWQDGKPSLASLIKLAVAQSPDGARTLTVFDDGRAASVTLSAEWARSLAGLLTIEADHGNDGD